MSQKEMPWMVDGKPGKVLAALAMAQKNVDRVGKRQKGDMSFQDADEVQAVGIAAINDAGLIHCLKLSIPEIRQTGLVNKHGVHLNEVLVTATLTLIHPEDGSSHSWTSSATGLVNGLGKYTAACNTAARKQAWLSALGISTGASDGVHQEPEPEPEPEPLPPEVEEMIAELEAAQTRQDLLAVTAMDTYKAIRGKWRAHLRHVGRAQEARVTRLGGHVFAPRAERDDVPEGEIPRRERKYNKK